MEELRGQILLFDEILTMSARMSAATADPQWEARYRRFDPQLSQALEEAARLAPEWGSGQAAAETNATNTQLVAMENRAFELVHQGQRAGALQLLASEEYASQKKVYSDGTAELRRFLKQTIDSVRARGQVDTRRVSLSAVIAGLLLIPGWLFLLQAAPR